jgi:hypothetical protein
MTDKELLAVIAGTKKLPPKAASLAVKFIHVGRQDKDGPFAAIAKATDGGANPPLKLVKAGRIDFAREVIGVLAKKAFLGEAAAFLAKVDVALAGPALKAKFIAAGLVPMLVRALNASADEARKVLKKVADVLSFTIPNGAGGPIPPPEPEDEEDEMSLYMDARGLPSDLTDDDAAKQKKKQSDYIDAVETHLKSVIGVDPADNVLSAVVGKLLRRGQFNAASSSFHEAVVSAHRELTAQYDARGNKKLTGIEVVDAIVGELGKKDVAYQQLAFILDETLVTLGTITTTDASFTNRVERAYLDYASGDLGNDPLDIPRLDQTSDGDIIPENMLAVGKMYAAYQLEQLRLFAVVDRITELWLQGLLPIGNDSGGRLLNQFWWDRENRLSEAARMVHYGRLFGAKGVDVSKEVQAHSQFDTLMVRFMTNVSQYKRLTEMQVVSSDPGQSRSLMSENVRKTGRELAANLSLYGWGATHYDSSRIAAHVKASFDIIKDLQVEKAFAATTPAQVIERVSQQEFGITPAILKLQTMADAGQAIIKIIAANPQAFVDPASGEINVALGQATFDELSRQSLAWLSVNGLTTDQLSKLSQPIEAVSSPALPTLQAIAPTPASNGDNPSLARLRDMVASGRMPSLEELRTFVN